MRYLILLLVLSLFILIKADTKDGNDTKSKEPTQKSQQEQQSQDLVTAKTNASPPQTNVQNTNNSLQSPKQPLKPKIAVLTSYLCTKKCRCGSNTKFLDCTSLNLTTLFTNDEWETLLNGDIQFEIIRLDYNNLDEIPILPELPSVKKLVLSYNSINRIKPTAFKDLQNLQILDLSYNQLQSKELIPGIFEGRYSPTNYEPLGNMKELYLDYNQLHTLDQDLFEHFPNLEKLSLSGNSFQVIDRMTEFAISSLSNLKTLDLSYMELKDLPEHIFHAPRRLENLNLTGNLFEEIPKALSYAINLRTLKLDENPLKNLENDNVFPNLTKLEILSMSFLKHTKSFGQNSFSKLQNLKEFYATNNVYLSEIHPNAFARPVLNTTIFDYPPIEKLFIHNNNLTIIPKALLERWDKVNVIDIRMNPFKCDSDNDFLIHDLYPQIARDTPVLKTQIECSEPINYKGTSISEIYDKKRKLRGPDSYGNHPENDGAILIGMLIGILTGIPIAFVIFVIYKRGCFGILKRPNDYGGALYKRADFRDEL